MKTKIHILTLLNLLLIFVQTTNAQWSSNPQLNTAICDVEQRQTLPNQKLQLQVIMVVS